LDDFDRLWSTLADFERFFTILTDFGRLLPDFAVPEQFKAAQADSGRRWPFFAHHRNLVHSF
jgi:hypothetical protein